ncbi:MAG: hypothetical protein ACFFCX_16695 [Candidatus Sifarchaeia archaeon]
MMTVTTYHSNIMDNETQNQETSIQDNNDEKYITEPDDEYDYPMVYSLDGKSIDSIPDFVLESENGESASSEFIPAAIDSNKPNLTAIYYQNMTSGDGGWVTWMQPGEDVRIWFQVKGPISISGSIILVQFVAVISESSGYGTWFIEASMNNWDINANETAWFTWDITLPDESTGNYGWGTGKCNAFTLSLYQPFLIVPPQAFEVFYEGLYSKYSFLHMFGEVYVKNVNWYNYTYDQPIHQMIPCNIAERYWGIFPEFEYHVINAPIWDIELRADMRRDIVWWPDETLIPYDSSNFTRLLPGTHIYQPEYGGTWTGWLLSQPWEYGSSIGQTRALYMKFHLYSGGSWSELYSSNDEGESLILVEGVLEQAPEIKILAPMDSEVITSSSVILQAMISDPNYNYQITSVDLYIDGIYTSIDMDLYDRVSGLLEANISLAGSTGTVNITLTATDSTDLLGSDTVIITTENPLDYFPPSYTSSFQHIEKVLASQIFQWEYPLTYSPDASLNITFTPTMEVGFDTTLGFDIYYSSPSDVFAGDEFATYVSVSDPVLTCSMWVTFELNYDITLNCFRTAGTITLYEEIWTASRTIPLGSEVLDLRYDLPGISEYIQQFTHYQIGFLDMIPLIGDFASLDLIVDVIPLLKISNVISADIAGTYCTPDRDSISFVSDKMFAITSTVDSDASGGMAEVLLNNVNLETTIGFDLGVNLTLTGEIIGITLANIDLNQWLYDCLGIKVPILSLWNAKSTYPLVSQIVLDVNVANQELEVGIIGLSADENYIDVGILLEDERDNGVEAGTITATVDSVSCTVIEGSNGEYTVRVPYRSTAFTLDIIFNKVGYIGGSDSFDIYIDPIIVDSTPPSIVPISTTPESPSSIESVSVRASLVDTLTNIVNPTLFYSTNGGSSWNSISMILISGTSYEGTIPAQSGGTTVLYYIQVFDEAGNQISSSQDSYTVLADTTTITTTPTTSTSTTTTTSTTDTTSATTSSSSTPPDQGSPMMLIIIGSAGAVGVILVIVFLMKKQR